MVSSQEKQITVGTILVNYKIAGQGQLVLILHGWGSSSDSWVQVQELLAEKGNRVIVLDLPGFGKTPAPSSVWGVEEYTNFVNQFVDLLTLKVNKSQKVILVGHSFGGQTAIQFAITHPEKVEKLVLIAAAGIRHEPGMKIKMFAVITRFMPRTIKNIAGSVLGKSDYQKANGVMKDIMKKVIRQDLTSQLSKVTMPTLIIWGDKDNLTPIQDAHVMQELIPNSKLEIIPNGQHSLNFQMPEKLAELISLFVK